MRRNTGLVYDEQYLRHCPGERHRSAPPAWRPIMQRLQETGLQELILIPARTRLRSPGSSASTTRSTSNAFSRLARKATPFLGSPTAVSALSLMTLRSWRWAGVFAAIENVMSGMVQNAFCAVRPPGHHAERSKALGFWFNNIALGVVYLLGKFRPGTGGHRRLGRAPRQRHPAPLRMRPPGVFYLSLHEDPLCYPVLATAAAGQGQRRGLQPDPSPPAGSGDEAYLKALNEQGLPRLLELRPRTVPLFPGFYAHEDDPLAHQTLTRGAYQQMGKTALAAGRGQRPRPPHQHPQGGYNLTVLADCVEDHLRLLLGEG